MGEVEHYGVANRVSNRSTSVYPGWQDEKHPQMKINLHQSKAENSECGKIRAEMPKFECANLFGNRDENKTVKVMHDLSLEKTARADIKTTTLEEDKSK